jgi:glyoxylase-like metal-dependent hydrolase (beta-lactamase superfamily II)
LGANRTYTISQLGISHIAPIRRGARAVSEHRREGYMTDHPAIQGFYHAQSGSIQYVVSCPTTGCCAVIDPVLDFDETSGASATRAADAILDYVRAHGLTVEWILDTHPHADHFSAAAYLRARTGAPTAIGERIIDVQKIWKDIYNLPESFPVDGSQWDRLFADGQTFRIGRVNVSVLHSPGHTLASITYLAGDAAFIHDTLFMPDSGSARADFPGGDPAMLWHSIQRILALPDETRLFTGHDYRPGGRAPRWQSTVAEQRSSNIHLTDARCESMFAQLRRKRDATLPMPKLMLHALQVNINGGRLPDLEANGRRYLRIPVDALSIAAWSRREEPT